jgi:effector-binding domain-containing protein
MKIAVIVFVLLIIIAFVPFQQHASISIKSNYFDVCQQFTFADNWKRWQPDIKDGFYQAKQGKLTTDSSGFLISIPGQAFKVEHVSANRFKVIRTVKHVDYSYFFIAIPNVANSNTTIIIDAENTLGKWLFSKLNPPIDILDIPKQVKNFMENARLYYGFNINPKKVDESCFAVKKETVPAKDKYSEMAKVAKDLYAFLKQNNIHALQPPSGGYSLPKNDSLQILIGIPVNKQLNSTCDITFIHMPGGKMLVGDFKGTYSDRQKLYNAMEKYIQDHSLEKQIAPFERYLDNRIPASDSDSVNMQINYPVR